MTFLNTHSCINIWIPIILSLHTSDAAKHIPLLCQNSALLTESSPFNPSYLPLSLNTPRRTDYRRNIIDKFTAKKLDKLLRRSGREMGSLVHPELGLDFRFPPKPYVQKPIGRFLADVSKIHTVSDKISKLDDYVNRLQDEMKKIDAFKRELPLCMLLLSDGAIHFPFFFHFIAFQVLDFFFLFMFFLKNISDCSLIFNVFGKW